MERYLPPPRRMSSPPRNYDPYAAFDCVRRAFPGDTVDAVYHDYADVFEKRPPVDDRMASVLRAMATDLTLGGLDSRGKGQKLQVAATGVGIRVFPRLNDEHLDRVTEAFETLSRRKENFDA